MWLYLAMRQNTVPKGKLFEKNLLGHSTLVMVERYLHLTAADASNAHRKASPVDNWML